MARPGLPGAERKAAGARAGAPVAGAAAQESAHITLTADAHAQSAMDKTFHLNAAFCGNVADLLQRQLPGENDPGKAHVPQLKRTGQAVHAHLSGAVQRQTRRHPLCQLRHGQVLHDQRIGPGGGHVPHSLLQAGQLGGIQGGVQRDVYFHISGMTKSRGLAQGCGGKVAGGPAGVKMQQPEIHSVRSRAHCRAEHVGIAGRRQNLRPVVPLKRHYFCSFK